MANKVVNYLKGLNPFVTQQVDVKKNLAGFLTPAQLARMRQDVMSWREAITEAENALYPKRVMMQRLFIDTVLNGHVTACMERRKDLTLLRKFEIVGGTDAQNKQVKSIFCDVKDDAGNTTYTPKKWLSDLISYNLDAIFFGYTLISLGDIKDDSFEDITLIKRWNINPDRKNVSSTMYSNFGEDFTAEPYKNWHIYTPTTNDTGTSTCGFGLLYKVGIYEIFLRNLLGYNGDFLEMFAQPYRVGKTQKAAGPERDEFEASIRSMGSAGYAIIDPMDEISFIETALGGTGYLGYENLEIRCEKKISKIILGHADAIDSTPGKLGANADDRSPAHLALIDKQSKDGVFIENVINKELIPRLIALGFNIPQGVSFAFANDAEQNAIRDKEDASNLKTAQIAQTMKSAGLQMDAKYFQDRTGIVATEFEEAESTPIDKVEDEPILKKLQNLYR